MASRSTFRVYNRLVNPLVRPILRSPLHHLFDRSLMLLSVMGRRSGTERVFPVQYAERDGDLFVFVGKSPDKRWWRNVVGGAPARVLLRGRRLEARAETVEDPAERAEALGSWLARFPRAARSVGVSRSEAGWRADELKRAAESVVMVRVRPGPGGSPSGASSP